LNNLFEYATSELSQDAFIAWLATWADDKYNNSHSSLNKLAHEFIDVLTGNTGIEVNSVKVRRQYENIDLVLILNNGDYLVCIEDKIDSKIHTNQLYRYKKNIESKEILKIDGIEYPAKEIFFCYFKTGIVNTYLEPLAIDYNIVNIEVMLNLFEKHPDALENEILNDYFNHLKEIENQQEKSWYALYKRLYKELTYDFAEKEINKKIESLEEKKKASSDDKNGYIEKKIKYLNDLSSEEMINLVKDEIFIIRQFSKVNNEGGGFAAYYWSNYNKGDYNTYFQFSQYTRNKEDKYRIEIRVSGQEHKSKSERKKTRDYLNEQYIEEYPDYFADFKHKSLGKTMAFVVLKGYEDIKLNDFLKNEEAVEKLVKRLKETLMIMDELADRI